MKKIYNAFFMVIIFSIVILCSIYYIFEIKTEKIEEIKIATKSMKKNKALGTTNVDRIYFFNTGDSDSMLIESQGHYGLVDTSKRYEKTIVDENGNTLDTSVNGLSNQEEMKNGKSIAQYLINIMGVNHLDFIIGTHNHLDHIGGVPGIASTKLVDNTTKYFYKEYGEVTSNINNNVWHNKAFAYQAKKSMQEKGATLIPLNVSNISNGTIIKAGDNLSNYPYSDIINSVKLNSVFKNISYNSGATNNWYDDNIYFEFGNYQIRLYNIFTTHSDWDENVNSIVTTVQKGNNKAVLMADINEQYYIEQKISEAINKDIGTVNLIKLAHHAKYLYSNSKETLDFLKPNICIGTRYTDNKKTNDLNFALTNFQYYAQKKYNTVFYETGKAGKAIIATFDTNNIVMNELNNLNIIVGANNTLNQRVPTSEGWSSWTKNTPNDTRTTFSDNSDNYYWMCFDSNKVAKTGWQFLGSSLGDRWYFFDNDGIMQTGWLSLNGKNYYLSKAASKENNITHGQMMTGWQYIDGGWYYFNESSGEMQTGWQKLFYKDKQYWFYLVEKDNQYSGYNKGKMLKGRHQVKYNGQILWYYFCEKAGEPSGYVSGAMISGMKYGNYTYDSSGADINSSPINYNLTVNPAGGKWNGKSENSIISQNLLTTKNLENPVPPLHRIKFNCNGGNKLNDVTVSDTFKGWTKAGIGELSGNTFTFGEGNATVTANYSKNSTKLPIPTRERYTFEGWYKEAECINKIGDAGTDYTPTADITMYSKWKENIFKSETYSIDEQFIYNIEPNTTYNMFKNNIETNREYTVKEKDKLVTDMDIIKTGDILTIDNKNYKLAVLGDINEDGRSDIKDILQVNKHRLGKITLIDEYLKAGDVNRDGKADIKDILIINKFRLGKITNF